jgi:glycosyltransferase involved in cell wall biosynthesis
MTHFPSGQAVVLFSTADWFWPYWTNKQHIAAKLAGRGFRVLYVESIGFRRPGLNSIDIARMWRRVRRAAQPIEEVQENVSLLSPLTIPGIHHWPGIEQLNAWQLGGRIQSWLRRFGAGSPIVWTYHPYMLQATKALNPTALIYHCVDNIGAVPGIDREAFDRAEHELLARCDRVFATSPALRDHCATIAPDRTDYFGNVVDVDHFSSARRDGPVPAELAAIPRPRLAYVGVLSDFKVDFALIAYAAARHPDWHFIFIGDEREGQQSAVLARLRTRTNVHLLGWRPYEQLPNYLRGIDVALLPQQINNYTRAMFPMKYFEYLAAGRPVVATKLPALAEFTTLHRQASDPDTFVDAVACALANPAVIPLDHPALRTHTWDACLDVMLERIAASLRLSGD